MIDLKILAVDNNSDSNITRFFIFRMAEIAGNLLPVRIIPVPWNIVYDQCNNQHNDHSA